MDGLVSLLLHPVPFLYVLSFASMFAWPSLIGPGSGKLELGACRDISTDWFNLILGIFANALAHSLYCLWLIERIVHRHFKSKRPEDPMLNLGEALSRGGSFVSWCAFFWFRTVLPIIMTPILLAAEHECVIRYEQLLGSMLFADAAFTFFMFAASWSAERLGKGENKLREKASEASDETSPEGEAERGKKKKEKKEKRGEKVAENPREVTVEEEDEKPEEEKKED